MLRLIRYVAVVLIALLLLFSGAVWLADRNPAGPIARIVHAVVVAAGVRGQPLSPTPVAGAPVGGPFVLTDQTGRRIASSEFAGRWMLIYFGYTFCPDVCPTELQTVATVMQRLGPGAARLVPIFITVDPQRDTPSVLAAYVKLFDDRLIGLTGTPEDVAAVARDYRVYYAKVTTANTSGYLMDHSSFLYLMGPDGGFQAVFGPERSPDEIAGGIRSAMVQP